MDSLSWMTLNFIITLSLHFTYLLTTEFLHVEKGIVENPFFFFAIASIFGVGFILEYAKFRFPYEATYLRPTCNVLLCTYILMFIWAGFIPLMKTWFKTSFYFFPVVIVYGLLLFVYIRTVFLFRDHERLVAHPEERPVLSEPLV